MTTLLWEHNRNAGVTGEQRAEATMKQREETERSGGANGAQRAQ